mmetsp:Transcript_153971/g.286987  ORF Transcript_153971/g.286987 Transcript_153971/m.286987 type:complete len:84 (-) Transcript_153971:344-595(-)
MSIVEKVDDPHRRQQMLWHYEGAVLVVHVFCAAKFDSSSGYSKADRHVAQTSQNTEDREVTKGHEQQQCKQGTNAENVYLCRN